MNRSSINSTFLCVEDFINNDYDEYLSDITFDNLYLFDKDKYFTIPYDSWTGRSLGIVYRDETDWMI